MNKCIKEQNDSKVHFYHLNLIYLIIFIFSVQFDHLQEKYLAT